MYEKHFITSAIPRQSPVLDGDFELRVQLAHNSSCNYRCQYCHQEGDFVRSRKNYLTPDRVKTFFDAAKEFGCKQITITGGEPLTNPSIPKYLDSLQGEKVHIVTNGSLLSIQILNLISQCKVSSLSINLPSLSEEIYTYLTGQHAVLPTQIIENIQHAISLGITVKINVVINRGVNDTREELERMLEFCFANGIKTVKILEAICTPYNKRLLQLHVPIANVIENAALPLEYKEPRPFGHRFVYSGGLNVDILKCGVCEKICDSCSSNGSLFVTSRGTLKPCMWHHQEITIDFSRPTIALAKAFELLRSSLHSTNHINDS